MNSVILNENENVSLNSPYGERGERSESSDVLDFTLKGYDQEIGAVRMGHRYYDSVTGKFLTPDPLFLENTEKCVESPTSCNVYGYASNDPIQKVDPSGLWEESVHHLSYDLAFSYYSQEARNYMKQGSDYIDSLPMQVFASQNYHSMADANQTKSQAIENTAKIISTIYSNVDFSSNKISKQDLIMLGGALHAVADSTSPVHGFDKSFSFVKPDALKHGSLKTSEERMQNFTPTKQQETIGRMREIDSLNSQTFKSDADRFKANWDAIKKWGDN